MERRLSIIENRIVKLLTKENKSLNRAQIKIAILGKTYSVAQGSALTRLLTKLIKEEILDIDISYPIHDPYFILAKKSISEETDKAMIAFGYFLNSYAHDFIKVVWGDTITADHMQSKFDGYYSTEGSNGVIRKFYSGLSQDNKSKLNAYIASNY